MREPWGVVSLAGSASAQLTGVYSSPPRVLCRGSRRGGASLLAHLALPMLPRVLTPEPRSLGAVGEPLNPLSSWHDARLADSSLDCASQHEKALASQSYRYMFAAMQQEC
jgi:hypothetical protein